jgi:hypothetical protein
MTVRVSAVEAPRRLKWTGTVGSRWLFEGRHTFELHSLEGDRTGLRNREEVSGILAPFALSEEPERDYKRMNQALKKRAERRT